MSCKGERCCKAATEPVIRTVKADNGGDQCWLQRELTTQDTKQLLVEHGANGDIGTPQVISGHKSGTTGTGDYNVRNGDCYDGCDRDHYDSKDSLSLLKSTDDSRESNV